MTEYIETKRLIQKMKYEYCKDCGMHCENCSVSDFLDWVEDFPAPDRVAVEQYLAAPFGPETVYCCPSCGSRIYHIKCHKEIR